MHVLPAGYRAAPVAREFGGSYSIVIDEHPKTFDQWVLDIPTVPENARILTRLLGGNGTLIDLGANIGTVAIPCAVAGHNVLAIEMLPQNVAKLLQSVMINRLTNMRVFQCGVSRSDGTLRYGGDEAWGHVVEDQSSAQAVALRLDTILATVRLAEPQFITKPLVIKIDVEGHELAALQGATDTIARYKPTVLFESIGDDSSVKNLLADAGYALFVVYKNIFAPRTPDEPQESAVSDFLAVPAGKEHRLHLQGYQVRALTSDEQREWREQTARELDEWQAKASQQK